jgi:hypothetical protein
VSDGKFFNIGGGLDFEIHLDAAGFAEAIRLAHRLGNHEDVAEQNRGVKTEPADRLQRDFGGEFGRLDELQESVFLLELAIFRQRASRLAHEPDRRTVNGAAAAGVEKTPAVCQRWRSGFGLVGGNGCHISTAEYAENPATASVFSPAIFTQLCPDGGFQLKQTMKNDPLQNELRELLSRLPDAPVASNFTARVLQAVDLEESRRARKWNFIFDWRAFLPRAAVAAVAVFFAGLTLQHHELNAHRATLAQKVALVAETPMPSVDALKNFDAIRRMSQPARPDEELLALMK